MTSQFTKPSQSWAFFNRTHHESLKRKQNSLWSELGPSFTVRVQNKPESSWPVASFPFSHATRASYSVPLCRPRQACEMQQ